MRNSKYDDRDAEGGRPKPDPRRVRQVMGWRSRVIDVLVMAVIACTLAAFAAGVWGFAQGRDFVWVAFWVGVSAAGFAAAFIGWCVQEVAAEDVVRAEMADEEEEGQGEGDS